MFVCCFCYFGVILLFICVVTVFQWQCHDEKALEMTFLNKNTFCSIYISFYYGHSLRVTYWSKQYSNNIKEKKIIMLKITTLTLIDGLESFWNVYVHRSFEREISSPYFVRKCWFRSFMIFKFNVSKISHIKLYLYLAIDTLFPFFNSLDLKNIIDMNF